MAKLRKRPGRIKSRPGPSNKLDHRIIKLMGMREDDLRKQKVLDEKEYLGRLERLTSIGRLHLKEKVKKKQFVLQKRFNDVIASFQAPLTFGLYFPDERKKELEYFTNLKDHFITGFIKSEANAVDLQKMGIEVRNQAGSIFTCNIPFKLLKKLSTSSLIDYVEIARPNYPDLGTGIPYAEIDTLHNADPAVTGDGVIVGIIDTTLDIYHVDFRNNDGAGGDGLGSTRVLFYWAQWRGANASESGPPVAPTLPGFNPVGGSTYGVEYDQADITTELNNYSAPGTPSPVPAYGTFRLPPSSTHGTHVAGIATGNGRSGNNGAAPNADIIHVELASADNYVTADSSQLADAFSYIFARAAQLGQPCVVNRSGSDNMGPHDGTTLGEQFIDNLLLTSGRVITFAAGNTDNKNSHIQGNVPNGGSTTIVANYFSTDSDGDGIPDRFPTRNDQIEIWYDGQDVFNVTLTIPDPAGTVIGPIAPGASSAVTPLANGNSVQIVHGSRDARNNDNVITIFITGVGVGASSIYLGNWSIQLTGTSVINGAFAAWLERNNRFRRTWVGPTSGDMTIATPATSIRSIAVGSHDTANPEPPNIAASSSAGPTRDGRIKPDISANGLGVFAARALNKNTNPASNLTFSQDGTSMAAPMVAGAVACLFECRGAGMNWFDAKQILWDNAGSPAIGIPSNKFGYGYLQMAGTCGAPNADGDVWLRDHATDTGIEPFVGGTSWLSPDIQVQDLARNPVANPTHDPASLISNLVQVTVRNRGSQKARNVQVFLHWADPGTNLPFPTTWNIDGIYTGDPNWIIENNFIVIPELDPGASMDVTFGWAPPAPGSNLRGDDHFCLLVRLETEADPSNIATGGWDKIRGSNNIALRNTHVQALPADDDSDAVETNFYMIGTNDIDSLWVETEDLSADVILNFPVEALVYRDARIISRYGKRGGYGSDCKDDILRRLRRTLKPEQAEMITGITGARAIVVKNGIAMIHKDPKQRLFIPRVLIRDGAKMPIAVRGIKPRLHQSDKGMIHVGQTTGGKRATGVTLEVWKELPKERKFKSWKEDGKLIIKRIE